MSEDFRPKHGQSFSDMIDAEKKSRMKAIEDGKKRPDSISHMHTLENCPDCGALAVHRELGLWTSFAAKRSTPTAEGIVTITCRVCEHEWQEDEMIKKVVKETAIS